jgi:hypothetical protein
MLCDESLAAFHTVLGTSTTRRVLDCVRRLSCRKGPCTYDCIALTDAHAVAQMMQRVDVRLAAFAHGDVLDNEAFVAPCAQRVHVEVFVLGRHIQRRGAVVEGQPALAGCEVLKRHVGGLAARTAARCVVCPCRRAQTRLSDLGWQCDAKGVEGTGSNVCVEGAIWFLGREPA